MVLPSVSPGLQRIFLLTIILLEAASGYASPEVRISSETPPHAAKVMTLEEQLQEAVSRSTSPSQEQKAIALLDNGADPNTQNGRSFCWAAALGREDLVRAFLRHGAKATPEAVKSALLGRDFSLGIVKILLNCGVDPNAVVSYLPMDDTGENDAPPLRYTLLMVAAEAGNAEAVKLLLGCGAKLNTRLPTGWTAFQVAAYKQDITLCELFLDLKADWRGAEELLLRLAIDNNDLALFDRLQKLGVLGHPVKWPSFGNLSLPMAKRMLAAGANPDGEQDTVNVSPSPMWIAVFNKDLPLARFLLAKGAHVDGALLAEAIPETFVSAARWKREVDALKRDQAEHPDPFAEDDGETEVGPRNTPEDLSLLQLLLDHGASPNQPDKFEQNTALHIAAAKNRKGAIVLLLKAGAKLEARNGRGETPLMLAVEATGDEAIPILLDAGANLEARDNSGNSPLMLAAWNRGASTVLVELLLRHGANAKAVNLKGATALHWAATIDDVESLGRLLEAGAVLEATDKNGLTPLGAACINGCYAAAQFLLQSGANPDYAGPGGKTARQICSEPFQPKMINSGSAKMPKYREKQDQEFLEGIAAPVNAGRKQIAALLAGIPVQNT